MNREAIKGAIQERRKLQQQRDAVLSEFSGLDPQNLQSPMALAGLLPKLPVLVQAFKDSQKIEKLSDEIIGGFIVLNMQEGGSDG